jgi:hypothetical protein
MACDQCGSPEREIWTFGRQPTLKRIDTGNWVWLDQCERCGVFWCCVPHEPHAAFNFWTRWPADRAAWRAVHDIDGARTLHAWHDAVLRARWQDLPDEERRAVESWRDRTHRNYNPIDRSDAEWSALPIQRASDLKKVLEGVSD